MLNGEKYKNEIKDLNYRFALREGKIEHCNPDNCRNCKFNDAINNCTTNKITWLLESSVLTEKERVYLKNIIVPIKSLVEFICKDAPPERDFEFITIASMNAPCGKWFTFATTKEMPFEGMELKKEYTLEELGL